MKNFLNSPRENALNEVVFSSRHKNYGAYAIRAEEGHVLKKSLFIGVSLFVILATIPLIYSNFKSSVELPSPENPTWVEMPPEMVLPPKVKPTVPNTVKPFEKVKTIDTSVPKPTRKEFIEKPTPNKDDFANAISSTNTTQGVETSTVVSTQTTNTTSVLPDKKIEPVTPDYSNRGPEETVDVSATFSGGIDKFREKVGENLDIGAFEGTNGVLKTMVTFIVEKDGSISAIKAIGNDADFNKEAERAIKSIKAKWNPAKYKNQKVRSYFRIPISMKFE